MSGFIPVNVPALKGNEEKYLTNCIKTGWISSEGPYINKFEDAFSQRVGRKYGVAVANGTAALDIAIESMGLKEGDEVILPAFTIISCVMQIVRCGAKPVLVDSDPVTWNMDVSQIEKKITPRTKAIMAVHIYGLPVDMDPILTLVKKYNLKLIEDAAQMHGQTYKGRPCGSFGDISTFSFYPNKLITTGEGGMLVTDNEFLRDEAQEFRNLCFTKDRFIHKRMGWNYRMTNMQAALGLAQTERLDQILNRKREIGQIYNNLLSEVDGVQLPCDNVDYADSIYWVYGLVLEPNSKLDPKTIMAKLGEKEIGTRPFFFPLHQQPVLKEMGLFEGEEYPVSESLYKRGFYIPSGLGITDEEINRVAQAIIEILGSK